MGVVDPEVASSEVVEEAGLDDLENHGRTEGVAIWVVTCDPASILSDHLVEYQAMQVSEDAKGEFEAALPLLEAVSLVVGAEEVVVKDLYLELVRVMLLKLVGAVK